MTRQVPSSSLAVTPLHQEGRATCADGASGGHDGQVDGLDVDATTALGRWLAARLAASDLGDVPVRTLWLPASELQSSASRRLIQDFANRQPDARLSVVAILPAGATLHDLTTHLALSGRCR